MRSHLAECIKSGEISRFPCLEKEVQHVTKTRSGNIKKGRSVPIAHRELNFLVCGDCRLPEHFSPQMWQYDGCDNWFHTTCYHTDVKTIDTNLNSLCYTCQSTKPNPPKKCPHETKMPAMVDYIHKLPNSIFLKIY